jgi:hypothetical protein
VHKAHRTGDRRVWIWRSVNGHSVPPVIVTAL